MPALKFSHSIAGSLTIETGIDQIAWGYSMNTVNYPTYGGEVIQILSCKVEELNLQGTVRNYAEMQEIYNFFFKCIDAAGGTSNKNAAGLITRSEEPVKIVYPERGWTFEVIIIEAPGYRQGRDVVAPTWQATAHIIDHTGDAERLSDLIRTEAAIKLATNDAENFGLRGQIGYIADNEFSDPFTKKGNEFDQFNDVKDYFSNTILEAYKDKDIDAIFKDVSSKPAFSPERGIKGNTSDDAPSVQVEKAQNKDG